MVRALGLVLLSLVLATGCAQKDKNKTSTDDLLECVLRNFQEANNSYNKDIVILNNPKWTDSTAYVSVIIDGSGLPNFTGDVWATNFQGSKIYHFVTGIDSLPPNNELEWIVRNNLKWELKTLNESKTQKEEQSPYDPPQLDFIYYSEGNCVQEFKIGNEQLVETLIANCDLCSIKN